MPQGGIDGPESPENAMKRELMEETGLNKNYKIIRKTKSMVRVQTSKRTGKCCLEWKIYWSKTIWFACRFFGNDDQVILKILKT